MERRPEGTTGKGRGVRKEGGRGGSARKPIRSRRDFAGDRASGHLGYAAYEEPDLLVLRDRLRTGGHRISTVGIPTSLDYGTHLAASRHREYSVGDDRLAAL